MTTHDPSNAEIQPPAKSNRKLLRLTFQHEVDTVAPTQIPEALGHSDESSVNGGDSSEQVFSKGANEYRSTVVDRWLDWAVMQSGSLWMFVVIMAVLLAWGFVGIPYPTETWQIVMGNGQAIFSYIWDSLLMRHQLASFEQTRRWTSQLRSRGTSKIRMMQTLVSSHEHSLASDEVSKLQDRTDGMEPLPILTMNPSQEFKASEQEHDIAELNLPQETLFGKAITWVSFIIGHIFSVGIYWVGFFIWIGFGPANNWSDDWQLEYNTALSAEMIFTFALLAIAREQNAGYQRECVKAVHRLDCAIEKRLRQLTDDAQSNLSIVTVMPKCNWIQSCINVYANVVGTLIGIALLFVCLIAWICIGPAMDFSTDWWLIIGTYAGLIGLHDGFVLRNMQWRLEQWTLPWFAAIKEDDEVINELLNKLKGSKTPTESVKTPLDVAAPSVAEPKPAEKMSFMDWTWHWTRVISDRMIILFAHEAAVVLDVLLIIGLVCGASVMKWNMTGQLLCNLPPMTLEAFMMQILITGHTALDVDMRNRIKELYDHRRKLHALLGSYNMSYSADQSRDNIQEKL